MKYWVLVTLLALMTACGSATPEGATAATDPPTATSLPPTDTPVLVSEAQPAEEPTATPLPTETPTTAPTEPPDPTPTEAEGSTSDTLNPTNTPPPTPAETPTSPPPEPTPAPAAQASGFAGFKDNLATADQLVINLSNLAAAPDGQAYHGLLIGDDGSTTDLGPLTPGADGSASLVWNSPGTENLLNQAAQVQIALQPAGTIVLSGGWQGDARASARQVFAVNDGPVSTPLNTPFASGLRAQTDAAGQHVQNAVNAAAIGALAETRSHLEHVVNIIAGANGSMFGDYNGNGAAENPGDGFGVLGYAGQISALLPAVSGEAASVQAQAEAMQNKAVEIMGIDDVGAASAQLGELKGMADEFKAVSVAGLYNTAQNAIRIELVAVE